MKKKLLYFGIVLALFGTIMLESCSDSETDKKDDNSSSDIENVDESVDNDSKKNTPFGIKSGIMEYTTNVMGTEMTATIYFDDYGNKQETVVKSSSQYMNTNTRAFEKDGYYYTIDLIKNTAQKVKMTDEMIEDSEDENINPDNFTDELKAEYNLKNEGTEKVMGKKCKVYSMTNPTGETTKLYMYKGVVLKMEMDGVLVYEVNKFEENVSMPKWFNKVPNGVEVTEIEIPDFNM